jgi:hypothetical protein
VLDVRSDRFRNTQGFLTKSVKELGPSFVNLFSLSEIYTGNVVTHDLQVQLKIAIKITLRDHSYSGTCAI